MDSLLSEKVTNVHHWTENLFSFVCTRSENFRFVSGQFTMIGLEINGRLLLRAYSIVSANYDDYLEFFSIKVPNGPLTQHLQHIKVGDNIFVSRKATGTLVLSNLQPGKRLWLIATGTGLAPFLSILKDPSTYQLFDYVILTHTCRYSRELAYRDFLEKLNQHEYLGKFIGSKLIYFPSVTRDCFHTFGRITDLVQSGKIFAEVRSKIGDINMDMKFDILVDRIMICGSANFSREFVTLLPEEFQEGNRNHPGHYVRERAFLE